MSEYLFNVIGYASSVFTISQSILYMSADNLINNQLLFKNNKYKILLIIDL